MGRGQRRSKRPGELSTAKLEKKTIAISRPVGKGKDTAVFVKMLGWTPFIFHTVELKPLDHRKIMEQFQSHLKNGPVDWIVFMSSTGVNLLFENPGSSHLQEALLKVNLLAVGPRTRDALVRHGSNQVMIPERYSSVGVDEFFSRSSAENLRIILVRSSSADDSLAISLSSKGAAVTTINVYESRVPKDLESAINFLEGLSAGVFSAVLFTSAVSVSNLFKIAATKLSEEHLTVLLKQVSVGSIGPATAQELQGHGIGSVLPETYLIEDAVRKLISN